MKKQLLVFYSVLICCFLLAGCSGKSPEKIEIRLNGEEVSSVDILSGEELTGLNAAVSPSDYEGEIVWASEDSGIVKIGGAQDSECTLIAKKTGSVKITATCGDISASVKVHVLKNQDNLSARETALTIHGVPYSAEQVTVCFADQYYSFIEQNGEYAAYYGLDTSLGIHSLAEQSCDYSTDGTWYGYFRDAAVQSLQQIQALCDYAAENGIALTDEAASDIEKKTTELDTKAADVGLESAAEYLSEYFGSGITTEMYRNYLEKAALADITYNNYVDSLSYTDEEISSHYAELGYQESENDYPVASMRHILIMAEADENGEYSEAAISAAHEKAVQLYKEWASGEKSEQSFAGLAENVSEDGGSASNGGLYENIYKGQMVDGINDWLFNKQRAIGDTAVIDNNGSYVGTHIVYFSGYGDLYCNVLSLDSLKETDVSGWLSEISADYAADKGGDFSNIGRA